MEAPGLGFHKQNIDVQRMRRATMEELDEVFLKYASLGEGTDQRFMTPSDFLVRYLGLPIACEETVALLASAIDTTGDGRISRGEFYAFETTLNLPDSLFRVAYQLFDQDGSGSISLDNVKDLMSRVVLRSTDQALPTFNFESDYVKLFFGSDFKHQLNYDEFTEFIQGYLQEYSTQAFWHQRKLRSGFVTPDVFSAIMTEIQPYQLTSWTTSHLTALAQVFNKGHNVNYAFFTAFQNLMKNMELVRRIYQSLSGRDRTYECTKVEFMIAAQRISQFTPMEVEILFTMSDLYEPRGYITLTDIERITPFEEGVLPYNIASQQKETIAERTYFSYVAEQVYRFGLGVIAGIAGTLVVYPIDSVKTRVQNQRNVIGESRAATTMMYNGYADCAKKVIQYEGFGALYNGIAAQCLGVGPEKAIKLTVNDLMRDMFRKDDVVPLPFEIVAGGVAGGCQVLFTNPLEIIKIRMQLDNTASLAGTFKDVGMRRLYVGASACLLRDIPFSAIYFPAYAHLKKSLSEEDGHLPIQYALLAGFLAGFPAAGLTTPADVIKTRLQAKQPEGVEPYKGLVKTALRISKEEGFNALWKGAGLRMVRSPPQFAVTLFVYELLQRFFQDRGMSFSSSKPIGSVHKPKTIHVADLPPINPDHVGGMKVAAATYAGIEHKFGLKLPRFKASDVPIYINTDSLSPDFTAPPAPEIPELENINIEAQNIESKSS